MLYGNGHGNGHHPNGHGNGHPGNGHPGNGHGERTALADLAEALQGDGVHLRAVTAPYRGANGHSGNGNGNGHRANGHGNGNGNGHAVATLRLAPAAAGRILEPWIETAAEERPSLYLRFGKRALDVVGATLGLLLFGPVMLLIAILIKLDSRGPIFYKSTRMGRDGKPFTFVKFRSMYVGADRDRKDLLHLNEVDGPVFKITRDPRTTRIGRFLRQTSIDELPQFYNVLCGEMSLVGPRPPLPDEVKQYEAWQRRRLDVKPGLTCLWQISGRSRLGFNEWMRLDLEYIRRQSFWTDLKIILRTIPAVVSRDGAY